ncbi:MAG TPA: bifunctional ADP-dependent NAD(P)H-hydrate dehydratase/NAD(P)H-hydrate epimerase [Lachnospiraceae bacterium]|nr:bifunctional ADP-dependent NAD(P)H-hydrate dehydratase/NAD(P)H-hydrate epimerase [Lachnospiraceae bacterium]
MERVVDASLMKSADRGTTVNTGIPSVVLMEKAALCVCAEVKKRIPVSEEKDVRVLIVCGVGNNGGDGLAVARLLEEDGYEVFVHLLKNDHPLSNENETQLNILNNLKIPVSYDVPSGEYDVVIDAIFGIGLTRECVGIYKDSIEVMNKIRGLKIAVDIPSGINSDTGEITGACFKADITVTFGFYKFGHLLYPGREYCGKVIKYGIGIDRSFTVVSSNKPNTHFLEKSDIKTLLPVRKKDSHKGTYGRAGVIAGSKEIGGALILASKACFSMGVGYVKALTEESNKEALLKTLPETLIFTYTDDRKVSEGSRAITEREVNEIEEGLKKLKDCDCVLIGPGIGTGSLAKALFLRTLSNIDADLIVDADAINLIAKDEECKNALITYAKKKRKEGRGVILTPHKAEFSRISRLDKDSDIKTLNDAALKLCKDLSSFIILKGASTIIYTPEGERFINLSGNSGMATAGSGDVLSGILAGLFAYESVSGLLVALGVYIHGLAGDMASIDKTEYSLTALDIANSIPEVLKENL